MSPPRTDLGRCLEGLERVAEAAERLGLDAAAPRATLAAARTRLGFPGTAFGGFVAFSVYLPAYLRTEYTLEPGALEAQYIEEYFTEFRKKKTVEEIIARLKDREHLIAGRPVERLRYEPATMGSHQLEREPDGRPAPGVTLAFAFTSRPTPARSVPSRWSWAA